MEKTRFYVGEKGKNQILDHNGMLPGNSHDETMVRTEFWLAKQIGTDLVKHYPNRQWHVDVDSRNQTIIISCPSLSKREGYRLHMKRDTVVDLLPRCRRAAAEILERFNVTRNRIVDPYAIESMARDVRDDVICADRKDTVDGWNVNRTQH